MCATKQVLRRLNASLHGQLPDTTAAAAGAPAEAAELRTDAAQVQIELSVCSALEEAIPERPWAAGSGTFECSLCMEEVHEGELVRRLPCAHAFHAKCVGRWLFTEQAGERYHTGPLQPKLFREQTIWMG